ncbi:MAG: hypothetical protein AAFR21_07035 [Pseudomonadota bacterium]
MSETDDKKELTRAERIFVRISIIQTILAVTGFFVGIIALFAALNEADAVRKQQMASVWPYAYMRTVNYGTEGEEKFEVIVGNRGIGPARIQTVEVTLDDQVMLSWGQILREIAGEQSFGISSNRLNGTVLAPGEDMLAFAVEAENASLEIVEETRGLVRSGRVNMKICYCSVFNDCWRVNGAAEETVPVKACEKTDPKNSI